MTEVVAALIWNVDKFMICQRPAHKARGLFGSSLEVKLNLGKPKNKLLYVNVRKNLP